MEIEIDFDFWLIMIEIEINFDGDWDWLRLILMEMMNLIEMYIYWDESNELIFFIFAFRLDQVDLVDARSRKAGQYSGGMRRRLCVAVAFIGASDVVLLDEPVIIYFERKKKSIGTKPKEIQRIYNSTSLH